MRTSALLIGLLVISNAIGNAEDWPRFRGPAGNGVATGTSKLPTAWSPEANLLWKAPLPGPGASSPIIIGGKALVTCYSGYGLSQENPGEIKDLTRHLVCIDLHTGKQLWQRDVKASLPEDPYSGIGVTAHGYASHTPVSDGKNVYAFFGKGGVHAFDLDGNKLWEASVGKESDPSKWGSSSSPIVYEDTVIITASAESQAIVGIDKATGKERWRQEAKGLDGMWGTPSLVSIDGERTDLVMCVARELWGLDPRSGKLRWHADATNSQQSYTSIIADGKRVYAFTGRGGGSIAVDAGGSGNTSESNTIWEGRDNASFASPVRHRGKLYVVANGIVSVVDAKTGERVERLRLQGAQRTGGRFGSLDYPSPIVAGNHLYSLNGSGQMFVFALGEKTEQVALNRVTTDRETFWGSPAVSEGHLVLRSSKHLYCVVDKGESDQVKPTEVLAVAEEEPEQPAGGRGGRGGGRFDPMSMFNQIDADKDGKVTMKELEGNRMADRLKTLDKDEDGSISQEEFRTGFSSLFRGGGGGGRGGRGGRGGPNYQRQDNRPDRPQRPVAVEE